jgi:hypothetical protein
MTESTKYRSDIKIFLYIMITGKKDISRISPLSLRQRRLKNEGLFYLDYPDYNRGVNQ